MNESNSIDDTYIKRRTVVSGKYTEVLIKDIGHIDKSTIGILIDIAEDNYIIELSKDSKFKDLFNKLSIVDFDNINDIKGQSIDLVFNSDMDKCGFEKDNYNYNIKYVKNDTYKFEDDFHVEKTIKNNLLHNKYEESKSDNKKGLKLDINSVEQICDNSFKLISKTEYGSKLTWDIDIPLTTESDSSEAAKLIEEEGGGKPSYLSDMGTIFIVNKNDVDKNLDYICYDESDTWALVVPSTYDSWEKYEPSNTTNNKDVSYKERSTSKNNNVSVGFSALIKKLFPMAGFILIYYAFIQPMLLDMQAESEASVELINTLITISELMIHMSMILIILTTITHFIKYSFK